MSDDERSSLDYTPLAILAETTEEVRESEEPPTKALIILLWDDDGEYSIGFRNAGLSCTQGIALCEVMKQKFLAIMDRRQRERDGEEEEDDDL